MNTDERGSEEAGIVAERSGDARVGRRLEHAGTTRQVIGAFFEAYNELGFGFAESVYREALAIVLESRGLDCSREAPLVVRFRGRSVGVFRPDFVVAGAVIVEVKARGSIENADRAQLLNYLRCADIGVGLLLNFGPRAEFERLVGRRSKSDV